MAELQEWQQGYGTWVQAMGDYRLILSSVDKNGEWWHMRIVHNVPGEARPECIRFKGLYHKKELDEAKQHGTAALAIIGRGSGR